MERVLASKASWLAKHGWEVVIVTTEQQGRPKAFEVPETVKFIDLGVGYEDNNGKSLASKVSGFLFKKMHHRRALKAVFAAEKPDVAVSMFCGDEHFLPRLAGEKCTTVLECHFTRAKRLLYGREGLWGVADRVRSVREPRAALKYDYFVVLTGEDCEYWLADCPALKRNIRVIPNARTFAPEDVPQMSRERRTVLSVGRYCHQKNPEAMLEIWGLIPEIERRGWTLRMSGDGELRPALEEKAAKLGFSSDEVVFGPAADIKAEYAAASIFVLTSRYEGLPMVLLEAQAAGLPIVSYECKCGPRDIVNDDFDGFLIPEGDMVAFAAKLRRLMRDSALRAKMGSRAAQFSGRFQEDRIMDMWMNIFE